MYNRGGFSVSKAWLETLSFQNLCNFPEVKQPKKSSNYSFTGLFLVPESLLYQITKLHKVMIDLG